MLTAEARIKPGQADRYLIQLCRHANSIDHKILRQGTGAPRAAARRMVRE